MIYNVDFEICSILFMLLLMGIAGTKRQLNDFQSRIFWIYLIVAFCNNCLNIVTCYMSTYYMTIPVLAAIIANGIYLADQFILPVLLFYYVYDRISPKWNRNIFLDGLFYLPASLGIVMTISSYWTHWIYFVDHNGYHHGRFHICLYLFVFLYAIAAFMLIVVHRKKLKRRQLFSLFLLLFVTVSPPAVQFFFPSYMLTGMATALSVFVIYFSLEQMASYEDSVTGALNRNAFNAHIRDQLHRRISENVFMLGVDNFKIVNDTYGMGVGDSVLQKLVAALQKEYGLNHVFRIDGDRFAVVCSEQVEIAKVLERLRRILSRKWRVRRVSLEISACICLVHSGQHGEEDVIHAMDYAMGRVKKLGKGGFLELDEDVMEEMARLAEIERALVEAVEAETFEVHYQPIYDVHTGKFHSMEALARLQVPGYGYVSPEEFILVSEKNGTILKVGLLILEEVCKFINEYDLRAKGIEFIEVNLSVVQCMQEKIYEDIMGVLKKYHIPPEMINLEITESVEAYSQERLIRNMARLSLTDITFSLDDYGSGYSNINYLVDLPFSIVKIDKYIVWAAMKKFSSRRVLENTIGMFKDINLKIVTEGIEDQEMMKMVVDMGADYLQGYYFSKPVPKEKLVECLEEGYLEKLLEK